MLARKSRYDERGSGFRGCRSFLAPSVLAVKWSICADTWLILPAVICSDKRLSHACLRTYLDTTNLWSTFGICLGPFWEFTKHERGSGKTRKTCHRRHNVRSAVSAHISPGALLLALSREKRKLRAQYWVPLAYGVIWACLLEFLSEHIRSTTNLDKLFLRSKRAMCACFRVSRWSGFVYGSARVEPDR